MKRKLNQVFQISRRLEIPKKHFRNTNQHSSQSQVCPLVLAAVHGADTLVLLTAATSSWSLHPLGRALITLPLAVESPFQGCCNLKCLWGSKESGSIDSPNSKRLHKASRLTRDALASRSQGEAQEQDFHSYSSVTQECQGLTGKSLSSREPLKRS